MNETQKLSSEYIDFLAQDCDRTSFIVNYLEKRGVKSAVINIDERRHIYVNFPKEQYSGYFRIKTLIAHYDRVKESPGANDNSFAVFTMMNWAVALNEKNIQHNIRLIFTDGEEMDALQGQGAFSLAGTFRRLGITNDDVYVFDCMGRGTIPVLQKPPILDKAKPEFKKKFNALFNKTQAILQTAAGGSWVTLPVSWSDNAGFIASGIPAVLVTMLPEDEASAYMMSLTKNPELEDFVVNHKAPTQSERELFSSMIPETWKFLHSKKDSPESITAESAYVFERILNVIALFKGTSVTILRDICRGADILRFRSSD